MDLYKGSVFMNKIEITAENYQEYQDFLDISNYSALGNHIILWSIGITIIASGIVGGVTVGMMPIMKLIYMLVGGISNPISALLVGVVVLQFILVV